METRREKITTHKIIIKYKEGIRWYTMGKVVKI